MKPRVYVETSVISYSAARPSRDLNVAARQQIEVIASWNFRHIASVWARSRIEAAFTELGYGACHIATPDELIEGEPS